MIQLSKDLVDKTNILESVVSTSIKNLWILNNKEPFNNLFFLKDFKAIDEKLKGYKDASRKSFETSIVNVLTLYKDKPLYKKTYNHYYDEFMKQPIDIKEEVTDEKIQQSNINWMSWEMVMNVKSLLCEVVLSFARNKIITPQEFEILLAYLILSLYTDIQPRRNQDYLEMVVVDNYNDALDNTKNYLDWSNKKLIFNHYKASKKYGKQTVDFEDTDNLLNTISLYLKFHPLNPVPSLKKLPKGTNFKFLVFGDGSPLVAVNSITRILNKIFGRKIGSSMLRDIYLTSKSSVKEESITKEEDKNENIVKEDEEKNINIVKEEVKEVVKEEVKEVKEEVKKEKKKVKAKDNTINKEIPILEG
jgi:hypothetical protein